MPVNLNLSGYSELEFEWLLTRAMPVNLNLSGYSELEFEWLLTRAMPVNLNLSGRRFKNPMILVAKICHGDSGSGWLLRQVVKSMSSTSQSATDSTPALRP